MTDAPHFPPHGGLPSTPAPVLPPPPAARQAPAPRTPAPRTPAPRTPAPRAKRKHPSHGARVVALVSSLAATGGLSAAMATASHAAGTVGTVSGLSSTTGSTGTASSSSSSSATSAAVTYADGTYLGSQVDNHYGLVEVQITVANHQVTAVSLVESPSDGRSQHINSSAAPILEQEAIASQTSTLDIVSGATYTTRAYATSLQAALDKAAATPTTATAASR